MEGKPVYLLFIDPQFFFPGFPQDTGDFLLPAVLVKYALDPESFPAYTHGAGIRAGKITAGKAEVIDGIQQIGLSHPVLPADAHHPPLERKGCLVVIPELGQGKTGKLQGDDLPRKHTP